MVLGMLFTVYILTAYLQPPFVLLSHLISSQYLSRYEISLQAIHTHGHQHKLAAVTKGEIDDVCLSPPSHIPFESPIMSLCFSESSKGGISQH